MATHALLALSWLGALSLAGAALRPARAQAPVRPENVGSLWEAATRAADAGRLEESRRLMAGAVARAPPPAVLYGLARANALTGRASEALSVLDRLAAMGFARF